MPPRRRHPTALPSSEPEPHSLAAAYMKRSPTDRASPADFAALTARHPQGLRRASIHTMVAPVRIGATRGVLTVLVVVAGFLSVTWGGRALADHGAWNFHNYVFWDPSPSTYSGYTKLAAADHVDLFIEIPRV